MTTQVQAGTAPPSGLSFRSLVLPRLSALVARGADAGMSVADAAETLQLRAANGVRPVLRLIDWQMTPAAWVILDSLLNELFSVATT